MIKHEKSQLKDLRALKEDEVEVGEAPLKATAVMRPVTAGRTYRLKEVEQVPASFVTDLLHVKPHMRSHYELFMGVP